VQQRPGLKPAPTDRIRMLWISTNPAK
jgi:hypothetical protein